MLCDNGDMRIVLEVLFSIAFVGLFTFIGVLRMGQVFPRLGRWLDSKLGGDWFDDQR